jgi:hypothetical protein
MTWEAPHPGIPVHFQWKFLLRSVNRPVSGKSFLCRLLVSPAQHNDVASPESVFSVKVCKPRGGLIGFEMSR